MKTDGEDGAELEEGRDLSDEVRIVAASASGVDRQSLCAASKQMPSSVSC